MAAALPCCTAPRGGLGCSSAQPSGSDNLCICGTVNCLHCACWLPRNRHNQTRAVPTRLLNNWEKSIPLVSLNQ